jgi:hypothetical protein
VRFASHASAEFWKLYHSLSPETQQQADKQFALFEKDPFHPSLHLKPVGEFWSVRVNQAVRALALRDEQVFYWFWIGAHRKYESIIR